MSCIISMSWLRVRSMSDVSDDGWMVLLLFCMALVVEMAFSARSGLEITCTINHECLEWIIVVCLPPFTVQSCQIKASLIQR